MQKILVVEDDLTLSQGIEFTLIKEGVKPKGRVATATLFRHVYKYFIK